MIRIGLLFKKGYAVAGFDQLDREPQSGQSSACYDDIIHIVFSR